MSVWFVMMIIWAVLFFSIKRRRMARWERRALRRGWGPGWSEEGQVRPADPARDETVEALETRIARLEERLDFTERLLEKRSRVDGGEEE